MAKKTFYQILGLREDADAATIKAVYRRIAKQYHPDASGDNATAKVFVAANRAHSILINPQKRARYDAALRARRDALAKRQALAATEPQPAEHEEAGQDETVLRRHWTAWLGKASLLMIAACGIATLCVFLWPQPNDDVTPRPMAIALQPSIAPTPAASPAPIEASPTPLAIAPEPSSAPTPSPSAVIAVATSSSMLQNDRTDPTPPPIQASLASPTPTAVPGPTAMPSPSPAVAVATLGPVKVDPNAAKLIEKRWGEKDAADIIDFARRRDALTGDDLIAAIKAKIVETSSRRQSTVNLANPVWENGQLVGLTVQGSHLESIRPLWGLPLRDLTLSNCLMLSNLEGLEGMPLAQLTLSHCDSLKNLDGLVLNSPANVILSYCHNLKTLAGANSLGSLAITYCNSLKDLEGLKSQSLTSLTISYSSIVSLAGIESNSLASFRVDYCSKLKSLDGVQACPQATFSVSYCNQLEDVRALKGPREHKPAISYCEALTSLAGLEGVPLSVSGCNKLDTDSLAILAGKQPARPTSLPGTLPLAATAKPSPSATASIATSLPAGIDAKAAKLILRKCGEKDAADIIEFAKTRNGLAEKAMVEALAAKFNQLNPGAQFSARNFVMVYEDGKPVEMTLRWADVESLKPLWGMPLKRLNLNWSKTITNLRGLEGMPLEKLAIQWYHGLTSLDGIEACPLTDLSISWSESLVDGSALKGLPLKTVSFFCCDKLPEAKTVTGRRPTTTTAK